MKKLEMKEKSLPELAPSELNKPKHMPRKIVELHSGQRFTVQNDQFINMLYEENLNVVNFIKRHEDKYVSVKPYKLTLDEVYLSGTNIVQVTLTNQDSFFNDATLLNSGVYAWEITVGKKKMIRWCEHWTKSRNDNVELGYIYFIWKQFKKAIEEHPDLDQFMLIYIGQTERTVAERLREEYEQMYNGQPSNQKTLTFFLKTLSKEHEYPTRVCLISKNGALEMEEAVGKLFNIIPGVSGKEPNAINRAELGHRPTI